MPEPVLYLQPVQKALSELLKLAAKTGIMSIHDAQSNLLQGNCDGKLMAVATFFKAENVLLRNASGPTSCED